MRRSTAVKPKKEKKDKKPKQNGKKKKKGLIIAMIILLLLLVGFGVWFFFLRGSESDAARFCGETVSAADDEIRQMINGCDLYLSNFRIGAEKIIL